MKYISKRFVIGIRNCHINIPKSSKRLPVEILQAIFIRIAECVTKETVAEILKLSQEVQTVFAKELPKSFSNELLEIILKEIVDEILIDKYSQMEKKNPEKNAEEISEGIS